MADDAYTIDISEQLDALKAELLAELREELRAYADEHAWPAWMSVETAAAYCDLSVHALRKHLDRREIAFSQHAVGHRIFIARQAIDAWMTGNRHDPRRPTS